MIVLSFLSEQIVQINILEWKASLANKNNFCSSKICLVIRSQNIAAVRIWANVCVTA